MSLDQVLKGRVVKLFDSNIYRIFTYFAELSVDCFCHVVYLVMFLVYDCFLKIRIIFENVYWTVYDYLCFRRADDLLKIRSYLDVKKRTFAKIPNHLVIILGPEKPSHMDFARIISWCEPLGIKYISFYDHKNGIVPSLLFHAVKNYNSHILQKVKWGKPFSDDIKQASIKQINGYRWEGEIQVNVFGAEDGNQQLVDVAKELHSEECQHVDVASLGERLQQRLQTPPPDLAVVCGPALSYFACTPWHLRLTQFVRMTSHHDMKVSKFLNCLHQYSKSEQRYGK